MLSRHCISVDPFHQVMLGLVSSMLSPCHPLIGTYWIPLGLNPVVFSMFSTSALISCYLDSL